MKRPTRDNTESQKKITRRGLVLGGGMAGVVGLLGLRMRYLQVDQADQFRLLADENRINIHLIPHRAAVSLIAAAGSSPRIFPPTGSTSSESRPAMSKT